MVEIIVGHPGVVPVTEYDEYKLKVVPRYTRPLRK